MEEVKIILEDGIEKNVYSIFYLYNSKYYFIYTEKELDENGYVILHVVKVGKEIKTTPDGPLETGYMVGVEISDPEEWKQIQESISILVEDKKNGTQNQKIQYVPLNMLNTLKVVSKKTFKLVKDIIENDFKLALKDPTSIPVVTPVVEQVNPIISTEPVVQQTAVALPTNANVNQISQVENIQPSPMVNQIPTPISAVDTTSTIDPVNVAPENDLIIDYRTKFFEEQELNKQLQTKIDELNKKLEDVKKVIE